MTTSADSGRFPRIALISTHGYVAAIPPLGAADTGGQVVYVIELARKFAQLGYTVDVYTRRFEDQPEFDEVDDRVRVIRIPCGGPDFIPKEYLHRSLMEWCENALRFIKRDNLNYVFINSHYWDAGVAGQRLSEALSVCAACPYPAFAGTLEEAADGNRLPGKGRYVRDGVQLFRTHQA